MLVYVIDTVRVKDPNAFMSNMLYSKKLKSVKRRQKGIFDSGKSFEVKISAFSAFLHTENVEKLQKSPKFGVFRAFDR